MIRAMTSEELTLSNEYSVDVVIAGGLEVCLIGIVRFRSTGAII